MIVVFFFLFSPLGGDVHPNSRKGILATVADWLQSRRRVGNITDATSELPDFAVVYYKYFPGIKVRRLRRTRFWLPFRSIGLRPRHAMKKRKQE